MSRTGLVVSLVVALLAVTSSVDAQRRRGNQPPAPTAEQRETARTSYTRGQELFRAGSFAEAQAQFETAFGAIPNPVVLLSIAECQERQNLAGDAVGTLERYLAARTDAPDRAAVEARIAGLRARPATLAVTTTPPGAAIAVDGVATGRTSPAEVTVPPGEHTVQLTLSGHETANQPVTVTFGQRQEVTATLASAPGGGVGEDDIFGPDGGGGPSGGVGEGEGDPTPPPSAGVGAGVWVAAGIGGAALIAGTVFGFLALDAQSEFDAMPSQDRADDGQRLALFADIGFGVAAAGVITAIVLYATSDAADEDDASSEADEGGGDEPASESAGEGGEGGEGALDEGGEEGGHLPPKPAARHRSRDLRLTVAPVVGPSAGGIVVGARF